jgi:hypothetical protein
LLTVARRLIVPSGSVTRTNVSHAPTRGAVGDQRVGPGVLGAHVQTVDAGLQRHVAAAQVDDVETLRGADRGRVGDQRPEPAVT